MKRLLDLFCGAGGACKGYQQAGFDVTGIDSKPQPRYPGRFIQGDALRPPVNLREFDAIHASPPCQGYSISSNNGCHRDAPKLIPATRELLISCGKPYIIENVVGAPLQFPVELCGASFGLKSGQFDLARHRWFECSFAVLSPPCCHKRGQTIGVYGNGTNKWHREKFGRCITDAEKEEAMGIDWMNRRELANAIPPAFTCFLGNHLMHLLT